MTRTPAGYPGPRRILMRLVRAHAAAVAVGLAAFIAVFGGTRFAAQAATKAPGYSLANVGTFGGEPSIAANSRGELYDTTPSGGTVLYRSSDRGSTWTQATTADPASGDDCVFTDQSNAL